MEKFEAKNVALLPPPVTPLHRCLPAPSEPGKLHSDYKTHPHFLPNLGESASHSPKNTVFLFLPVHLLFLQRTLK